MGSSRPVTPVTFGLFSVRCNVPRHLLHGRGRKAYNQFRKSKWRGSQRHIANPMLNPELDPKPTVGRDAFARSQRLLHLDEPLGRILQGRATRPSSARTRQGMALWHPKGPICRRDAVGQRAALRASEKGKMTSCAFMRGGRPANPGEPSSSQSATAA